jgi:hypothetical protein
MAGVRHLAAAWAWAAAALRARAVAPNETHGRKVALIGGSCLVIAIVAAAIVGAHASANLGSGPSDNYCLLNVNDNEFGGSGVLAVPQANATQSVCDSVAASAQQSWDAGTNDTGAVFVVYGDKPGYLSACQQYHMTLFGTGDELPGWIVYSGTVAGIQAGGDGTKCS